MIYVFRCKGCNLVLTKEMSVQDYEIYRPTARCPNKACNSRKLVREYQDMAIIYRGDGFTKSARDKGEL